MTGKLWNCAKKYWKVILILLVLGPCIAFWLVPVILGVPAIQSVFTLSLSPTLVLFYAISILSLIIFYEPALRFWIRYKNNVKLPEIPFTYMDGIFCLLVSTILTILSIYIFQIKILHNLAISSDVELWLWIFGILFIIWCLLIEYKSRSCKRQTGPKPQKISNPDYFPDEPITDKTEDLLNREQFVDDLYHQIINYPFPDSFVFGLYGKWGEGKTSVLNLLRNKLEQNDDVIVFNFDPWYFSSTGALITNFYEELYRTLNQRFFLPNFKKIFIKYQKLLSSGLKLKGINMEMPWSGESLEELRASIERLILMTGKKIIILIDDIDRLQDKSEIHQILKLVKLSAKFKNTVFLLSFDPDIITRHLEEDTATDRGFLDKIIQAPIFLASVDQHDIDKFLYYSYSEEKHVSGIDRLFQKLQISQERIKVFEQDFNNLYGTQIKRLFTTLRAAKRYLNRLYQTLPSVKNEVHLEDFLILQLIAIFWPKVYDDIWSNSRYYLPLWGENSLTSAFFGLDENQKYQKIREHITEILEREKESEVLKKLLEKMFFEVENALAQTTDGGGADPRSAQLSQRITHPDSFPKYFMLKVPHTDIPDETIETMISRWNDLEPQALKTKFIEDLKKFKEQKQAGKLLTKLRLFLPYIEQKIAETIISMIYENIDFFSKEGSSSEQDKALFWMLDLINEKVKPGQIKHLLIQAIQETPCLDSATSIVLLCRRERGGSMFNIYDNIQIEDLHKTLSERLERYFIQEGRDIFVEEADSYSFILYQWGAYNQDDQRKVNEYVFGLFEINPHYLGKIMKTFIPSSRIKYDDLIKRYDENKLYEKAKANYPNTYSNQAEKSAIDLFLKDYEKRDASALQIAKEKSRKEQFSTAYSEAGIYFDNRNFESALEKINDALKFTDWPDEQGWINQVKFMKWKCLIELSFRNGQELKKEYFTQACTMAGNEAQINKLVDSAYPNGPPDQAPVELYYCLFYYLQWKFFEAEQKPTAKENFMTHHAIATGNRTSGRSADIASRCDVLLKMMNS